MAGATKCYEMWLENGKLHQNLIEHSPHFADSVTVAVTKVWAGQKAKIAPPKLPEFLSRWGERLDILSQFRADVEIEANRIMDKSDTFSGAYYDAMTTVLERYGVKVRE